MDVRIIRCIDVWQTAKIESIVINQISKSWLVRVTYILFKNDLIDIFKMIKIELRFWVKESIS